MPILETLGGLGSMASMVALYRDLRKKKDAPGRDDLLQIEAAAAESSARLADDEDAQAAISKVIDDDLLDALEHNIRRAKDRLKKALGDVRNTPNQRDQEVEIARAEICSTLQTIKDFNGGDLPTKELQSLWDSNNCGSAIFP